MRVTWDALGDRVYTQGVDQGVLYSDDASGVTWNGLISVTEAGDQTVESKYIDGRKYRNRKSPSVFSGTISAYTYPDELEPYIGVSGVVTSQKRKLFGLTYRTNREIHVVYNIMAAPAHPQYSTAGDQINLSAFEWSFTTQPEKIPGGKPSSHFVIMVEDSHPTAIKALEGVLYGDDVTDPRLPAPEEILEIFESNTTLRITDNGDGTWTASGPDSVVSTLPVNRFKIVWPSIIFTDGPTVFTISSGWDGTITVPAIVGNVSLKKKQIAAAGAPFSTGIGSIRRKKMSVAGTGIVIAVEVSSASGAIKQKKKTIAGAGSVGEISMATAAVKQKKMRVSGASSAGTIINFIAGYGASGASRVIPVTAATQAGDTLLVICSSNSTVNYPTTLSDSKGNIYTPDRSAVASGPTMLCFRSPGATGGPGGTPTVALTTSDTLTAGMSGASSALGVVGAALPNTLIGDYDVIPASISGTSDTTPTATATPVTDRDIAIGLFANSLGGGSPAINSPFSSLVSYEAGAFHYMSITYRILPVGTSGVAQTSTETVISTGWKGILYLFKPA